MSYGQWGSYVSVAARKAQAAREIISLRKAGQSTTPVTIEGRAIAKTFWGKAWCDNLESYRDYENRLPRGRTYVRNGSVVDLQIAPSLVTAMVMGSSMYRISVTITPLPAPRWRALCQDCAGGIDSVVELLQGRFSKGVMERLCRQDAGLFPKPSEIKLSCSCPDYSDMCKHVAAALYGVGARLDAQPELLFRLRSVDEKEMVRHLDGGLSLSKPGPTTSAILDSGDLSALFGLDIADADAPPAKPAKAATVKSNGPKPSAPKVAVASARPKTPPIATTTAMLAAAGANVVKQTTRSKPPLPRGSKVSSKTEEPVRYLTVKQALQRSGKTPIKPRIAIGKPSQTEPVVQSAPKVSGRTISTARRKTA